MNDASTATTAGRSDDHPDATSAGAGGHGGFDTTGTCRKPTGSQSGSMMDCLRTLTERATSVAEGLASVTSQWTMTTRPGRFVAYYAPVATSYLRQYGMRRRSYGRQYVTSVIRQHERYWANETGRPTQTEDN